MIRLRLILSERLCDFTLKYAMMTPFFFQIKNYYEFKVKHASIYKDLLPSHERNVFQQNILTVQPNRDQLGRRMLIIELGSE